MGTYISIKNWGEDERPREKLIKNGPAHLSDSELLAILLHSGNAEKSAVDLSREVLMMAGNSFRGLNALSMEEMKLIPGIGPAKATSIKAALEIASRMVCEMPEHKPRIKSSADAARIISPVLKDLQHEECWAILLNRDCRVIAKEKISSGGISSTVFDSRIIVKKALEKLASAIILSHNHPSGNPYPGEADIRNTQTLREAAALFDISLTDHIIIAGERYYSFSDEAAT